MVFPSVCLRCKPEAASKVEFHGAEPLNNPANSLGTRNPTVALSDKAGVGAKVQEEVKEESKARE